MWRRFEIWVTAIRVDYFEPRIQSRSSFGETVFPSTGATKPFALRMLCGQKIFRSQNQKRFFFGVGKNRRFVFCFVLFLSESPSDSPALVVCHVQPLVGSWVGAGGCSSRRKRRSDGRRSASGGSQTWGSSSSSAPRSPLRLRLMPPRPRCLCSRGRRASAAGALWW